MNETLNLCSNVFGIELELEKARQYLNLAAVMIIALDEKGTVILSNRKACNVFECTEKQILKRDWFDFCMRNKEEIAAHAQISYQQIMKGDIGKVEYFESPFYTRSGKAKIIAWHNAFIRDANDKIIGVVCSGEDITARKHAEEALLKNKKKLETQARNLAEVNTALRVLLDKREEDKADIEKKVLFNVERLVLPFLDKLAGSNFNIEQKKWLTAIETNLKEIISPFPSRLISMYANLTPSEIKVAHLVKEGKRSKEIAELINLSTKTVEFHRNNIRKKFGIKNKSANLRSYLLSIK